MRVQARACVLCVVCRLRAPPPAGGPCIMGTCTPSRTQARARAFAGAHTHDRSRARAYLRFEIRATLEEQDSLSMHHLHPLSTPAKSAAIEGAHPHRGDSMFALLLCRLAWRHMGGHT